MNTGRYGYLDYASEDQYRMNRNEYGSVWMNTYLSSCMRLKDFTGKRINKSPRAHRHLFPGNPDYPERANPTILQQPCRHMNNDYGLRKTSGVLFLLQAIRYPK